MKTDTLIIGGGLAGLRLADLLQDAGQDFALLEARDRLGGRVLSDAHGASAFDLGPAWYWPGQPRMEALVARLGLNSFAQFSEGHLMLEQPDGQVQRARNQMSMQGSYRLDGGMHALISGLQDQIEQGRVHLSSPVESIAQSGQSLIATTASGQRFEAAQIALALPPRLAATLRFTPALPQDALDSMTTISTWMAGQAKAVAIYKQAFWRDAGLSGDAMSRRGPLVEIHDASTADGGGAALFGFIGYPPDMRRDEADLRQRIGAQLVRLFGPQAATPEALLIKDWAQDGFTSTPRDLEPLLAHPRYGLSAPLRGLWNGRLAFAGTEVAPQFGGYLEGALEAAENAFAQLLDVNRGAPS